MNKRIDQLIEQCTVQQFSDCVGGYETLDKENFAELIVDECCVKLLDMDGKANGRHNYYKHAAIELKRHFKEKS